MTVDRAAPLVEGYRDFTKIGSGGFATVYRATREAFGQTVAVKFVDLDGAPESAQMRFDRECRALGALAHHPHIVTVYDAGVASSGSPYLVMEYLPHGSLDRVGRMDVSDVLRIGVQVAGALETAHRAEILHRDVKPANILRSRYGDPVLADFGIARLAGGSRTTSGVVTASVAYAPPEVLEGKHPTAASDVWSLAATLVCLITGRTPFAGEAGDGGVPALIARIVRDELPDLAALGVPEDVAAALLQALVADPTRRTASALDFGRALRGVQRARGDRVTELLVEGESSENDVRPSTVTSVPPQPRSPTTISGPALPLRPAAQALTPLDTVPFAIPAAAHTPGRLRSWVRPVLIGGGLLAVSLLFGIAVLGGLAGSSATRDEAKTSAEPLVAGAGASGVEPVAAAPSTPPVGEVDPTSQFPSAMIGTWKGEVTERGAYGVENSFGIVLNLPSAGEGQVTYRLPMYRIECPGKVESRRTSNNTAVEILEIAPDQPCFADTRTATLTLDGDRLRYDSRSALGDEGSTILTRGTTR